MTIQIAVPTECMEGENRVALVPPISKKLIDLSVTIYLQSGAGKKAHYPDHLYENVTITKETKNCVENADIIFKVQAPTIEEINHYKKNAIVIGFMSPFQNQALISAMAEKHLTSFAVELIPRITRAQAMDALSSQASLAGYKSVLIAANHFSRFFPMLTTAAGTIKPAKVLIIGAGVAGLQAIATAKRLGAIVEAYDIRPEAREQVESLGAKMVNLNIDARGEGGYARELTDEEKAQQTQVLADHIAKNEIVISTAAIPGRPAPKIITQQMVEAMSPGSVIVDIAAETGGNCELTEKGKTISHQDVTIVGPCHLSSQMSRDASDMYARNLFNFAQLLIVEKQLKPNWDDEILKSSMLTHTGEITFGPMLNAK